MLNIIVPMARSGKRFAAYPKPKPLIDVLGRPMIDRVLENLAPVGIPYKIVCVMRRSLYTEEMAEIMDQHQASVVLLDQPTIGAMFTVQAARGVIISQTSPVITGPLVVAATDQLVDDGRIEQFYHESAASNWDGVSLTFPCSTIPTCSFCQVDETGRILRCAEKQQISCHANVGIYFFRNWDVWDYAFQKTIQYKMAYNDEYYVAPMYNFIYSSIHEVPASKVHLLGTPAQLERYIEQVTFSSGSGGVE